MPISRFIVDEESMLPAFKSGEHVLSLNWVEPKVGDVIVFKNKGRYFIKRIDKFIDNYVYVSGDNKVKSSRVGPIKKGMIVGKVIMKY